MTWQIDHVEARVYAEHIRPALGFDGLVNLARAYLEILHRADELEFERDQARQQLSGVLAVIHRDGGHHTERVGVAQSIEDAHVAVAKLHSAEECTE